MPLTIIIPTLGRSTLQRAVESVQSQTIPTEMMVEHDDMGLGAPNLRNLMISNVKTEWVGFCDDDDWLEPHYHEWLKETKADMVIFQMKRLDGMVLPDHTDLNKLVYNWVGISFAMRTKVAKRFKFKDMVGEDFELIQRVQKAGLRVVVSPRVAYFVGSH